MPLRLGTIARELGTALAVLSLYVLILLAPLHQAAGLQRDFDALGFASLDTWSICVPLTVDGSSEQPDIAKCPFAGIGKHEVALIEPTSIDIGTTVVANDVFYPRPAERVHTRAASKTGQARAPPVTV